MKVDLFKIWNQAIYLGLAWKGVVWHMNEIQSTVEVKRLIFGLRTCTIYVIHKHIGTQVDLAIKHTSGNTLYIILYMPHTHTDCSMMETNQLPSNIKIVERWAFSYRYEPIGRLINWLKGHQLGEETIIFSFDTSTSYLKSKRAVDALSTHITSK